MLTHIRTSKIVQRHNKQIIEGLYFYHLQPESLKKRFDCSQEDPQGCSTKLDLGPKISGVREKSLPASSVIYAPTTMDAHTARATVVVSQQKCNQYTKLASRSAGNSSSAIGQRRPWQP